MSDKLTDNLWVHDCIMRGSISETTSIWLRDKRSKVWIKIDGGNRRAKKISKLLLKTLNENRS